MALVPSALPSTVAELKQDLGGVLLQIGHAGVDYQASAASSQQLDSSIKIETAERWLAQFPVEVTELGAMAAAALNTSPGNEVAAMDSFVQACFGSPLIQALFARCPGDYLRRILTLTLKNGRKDFLTCLRVFRELPG